MRKGRARRRNKSSRPPAPIESRAPKGVELAAGAGPRDVSAGIETREARDTRREPEQPARRAPALEVVPAAEAAEAAEAEPESGGETEAIAAEAADAAGSAGADEISIPPVGDVVVDEFFSEGDVGRHLHGEDEEHELDAKLARKLAPEVVERRTRLARYVTWAVGAAGVLCVVALGRGLATSPPSPTEVKATTSLVMAATPKESPPAPTAEPGPKSADPAPAAVTTSESAKLELAPSAAAKAEEPKAEPAKAEEPKAEVTVDPKAAATEKSAARRALEAGRVGQAIEAGEKSVALDPSDGEAWLLLGAAYQEKGALTEARRCYVACVKQGKRGPIGECSAMLR